MNRSGDPVVGLVAVLLPRHQLEPEPPVAGVDDLGDLELERPRLVLREDADVQLPPHEYQLLHQLLHFHEFWKVVESNGGILNYQTLCIW